MTYKRQKQITQFHTHKEMKITLYQSTKSWLQNILCN